MASAETPRIESDALSSLEERILRAVQLVSLLRQEKDSAESLAQSYAADRDSAVEAMAELRSENARLVEELDSLRSDRKEVKSRIEKLLGQLDNLSV
ncbi:MAG: cell division protein ZapB [Bryobacteraceae bacterium]|nr:cell division protein ZapB [Bryobacteraceae bacterium]